MAGGLCVGLAALVIARLADLAQALFRGLTAPSPWLALLVTPLGFGLCALLAARALPRAAASGLPQVIAARRAGEGAVRDALVSLTAAGGAILLNILGLLFGASAGRDGPTALTGAAIMAAFERLDPRRRDGLILAGAAAGLAATFNAPIAGVVFAFEGFRRSRDRDGDAQVSGPTIATVAAALTVPLALGGGHAALGSPAGALPVGPDWIAILVIGLIGGASGGLFSRIVILFARGLPGRAGAAIARRPVAFAMLCGLGIALCGVASGGAVHGTGLDEARAFLHGAGGADPAYAPLKLLATLLSTIGGPPAGLFAPLLGAGAGIGAAMEGFFPAAPLGPLVLIGMAASLAGALRAPVTAVVLVIELSRDHSLAVPLLLAALIAAAASKRLCRQRLHHALADALIERSAPVAARA